MFAGKTEELIRRIKVLEFAKQKILVFKPDYEVDISGGILYNKIYRFELIISMRLRAWNGGEE